MKRIILAKKGITTSKLIIIGALIVVLVVGGIAAFWVTRTTSHSLHILAAVGSEAAIMKIIAPIMKEEYDTELIVEEAMSSEILAKALAQKDNPSVSVAIMDDEPWLRGKDIEDLWGKLDPNIMTNLDKITMEGAKMFTDGGDWVGMSYWDTGIIYNSKIFEEKGFTPPTSYEDLKNETYNGRLSIPTSVGTWSVSLLIMLNQMEGGDYFETVDPGFAWLKDFVETRDFIWHAKSSELFTLLEREEVWIACTGKDAMLRLAATGFPVKHVTPKEGGGVGFTGVTVMANAPELELAQIFANLVLGDEFQKEIWQTAWYSPTNLEIEFDPEYQNIYEENYPPDVMERLYSLDWAFISKERPAWRDRWLKDIGG